MPFGAIKRLLNGWSNQQESALSQMTNRKIVGKRIEGYGKSERVEAKFFLFASAPMILLFLVNDLGWERGLV